MVRFLWNTYNTRVVNHVLAGIAASEANAERCVRRAFEVDETITGATIWKVKLTASTDGQQFEWQLISIGPIYARNSERAVVRLPAGT